MLFYSTAGRVKNVSFQEAVLQGIAPDGGLYLPQTLPLFSSKRLKKIRGLSFLELSIDLGTTLFENVLTPEQVEKICEEALNLPIPFLTFPNQLHLLELFHGPSLSFKDFGTRFLASLLRMWKRAGEEILILTATSGDTGSAVGLAFCGLLGMRVYILFPKGRITPTQKQQLTAIGHNVKAIEVEGSFEACQNLVKEALLDADLQRVGRVTTANSVNIARLFPQALYYFYAYSQLAEHGPEAIFAVPSGNFGHLVSGMLAKQMGLPVHKFLGVTNINDEVPLFLRTGVFLPHEAYPTLAVSMDVGNPSNFPRLLKLYGDSLEKLRGDLIGISVTDDQIRESVKEVYAAHGYLLDPHSATAYHALHEYLKIEKGEHPGIFFATAHPSKFRESLSSIVSAPIHTPDRLQSLLDKPKHLITLPPSYDSLKEILFKKTSVF
jgi:threonine synthase